VGGFQYVPKFNFANYLRMVLDKILFRAIMGDGDTTVGGLVSSIVALLLSTMFLLSSTGPQMVSDTLISTDMLSNPRYGLTFPALKSIEAMDDDSVIAIGSSIIRAATDGECISANLEHENTGVYNLGISGAIPYTEILQIPALIAAEPELVIIDLGPNGLAEVRADNPERDEYIQFRFTINSIAMENEDIGNWTDLIREKDREWIALNDYERAKLTQEYSQRAAEYSLESLIHENFELVEFEQIAPLPGDEDWQEYLMKPYFREPYMEELTDEEVRSYFENKMPNIATWSIYNPKNNGTLNHQSYEYMIKELTSSDIPVLLLATPHHPYVYPYLSPGQLDDFNATFERYSNYDGVQGLNMYWETWHSSMFRDRNHLGVNGREYFCERIAPVIDGILESENISQIDLNTGFVNLSNYLEDGCEGNDVTNDIDLRYNFIQTESYSNCSWGDGFGFQDKWEFKTSNSNSGSGFLQGLPENNDQYKKGINGSRLDYSLKFTTEESYHIWIKMKGNSYGNDSIGIAWKFEGESYSLIERYDSFGWSTSGIWEWEPEFYRDPIMINASKNDIVTLSIWMLEDGVMIDEILITTDKDLKPKNTDPHTLANKPLNCEGSGNSWIVEKEQETFIEAEDYSSCVYGEGKSMNHKWETIIDYNSSNDAYVTALPDERLHVKDERGPGLNYDVYFPEGGIYFVWISMKGNSYSNDTIGLNWNSDGIESNMTVIASFAWNSYGQWEWEPQTSQEPLNISVSGGETATLTIWMREDGVQFDRFIITSDENFDPYEED